MIIGFLPWSLWLPVVAHKFWQDRRDDKSLFLILWVLLPLGFFSISKSKLPHYILPIFPALAILTAAALVDCYRRMESKIHLAASLAWLTQSVGVGYLVLGSFFPSILAASIRDGVSGMTDFVRAWGAALALGFIYLALSRNRAKNLGQFFLTHVAGLALFFAFSVEVMILIAPDRSAKPVAEKAISLISPATQLVFYDTHLAGMPFYLRSEKPIWLVTHEDKKRTFLGNYYLSAGIANPVSLAGDAIFDHDEFRKKWQSAREPLLIIVKEKNFQRLAKTVGESPKKLAAIDEYLLVTKQ
jgi:4-amino-4-deoxy-L-arabinose transferase-like glycosyltransferase